MVKNKLNSFGDLPDLPRYGMSIQLDAPYDHMEWLGRGPHENYSDRNKSTPYGKYAKSVKKDFFHYVRPQESNNYTGVDWVSLTDSQGVGIEILGSQPLSVSAWPYSAEDLSQKRGHKAALPDRSFITINIDMKQQGVGGDDSWSRKAKAHKEFTLSSDSYTYEFLIRPVVKKAKSINHQKLLNQ